MGLESIRYVECDGCGAEGPHALPSEDPEDMAEAEGWLLKRNGDTFCPECKNSECAKS